MINPIFIAEVKTESPFGFRSDKSWEELFEIANEYGDMVSIHTDYRWGGSFDLVEKARSKTDKPILAKGIHALDEEVNIAIESGADYVLVVGRLPGVHLEQCVIEPTNWRQICNYPIDTKVLWNQRELVGGGRKSFSFEQARELWPGWLVQASFITGLEDVNPSADAFIVGENLSEFVEQLIQE